MSRNKRGGGWRGGGRGGNRGGNRGGKGSGGRDNRKEDNRVSFEKLDKTNPTLEEYYNKLITFKDEDERARFWATLRTELPTSFRFTGSKADALALKDTFLARYSPQLQKADYAGQKVTPPAPLKWYPLDLAYSMDVPKNIVRKVDSFKEFQKFQVLETAVGNMNRQEVVSMIPPLFLDVEPDHAVLDMCAAPGSKTAQLIEALHKNEEENIKMAIARSAPDGKHTGQSKGVIIANDSNYKRAQMLVHQTKRLNSPNLIVTCHDATMFPSIAIVPPTGEKKGRYLYFDRILADVPCSGDGTLRKNANIWKDWSAKNALGLYITQVRILVRGLQMLKRGGRIVYSTCSMNPIEDEAVVSSAIERCGGSKNVEIVDCHGKLEGLKSRPGLKNWSIINRGGKVYDSWSEIHGDEDEPEHPDNGRIVPGMFGPDQREEIPLERCMRFYPHDQNTGGFFVTVLQRTDVDWTAKPENESKCVDKDWFFGKVYRKKDAPPADSATALLKAVDRGQLPPAKDSALANNGDVSAAERSNAMVLDSSTLKRKTEDDDDDLTTAKRVKQDIASAEDTAIGDVDEPRDAVMSRMDDLPPVSDNPPQTIQSQQYRGGKRDKDKQPEREYFNYLVPNHEQLESIYKFYSLHPAFPRDCFLVRNNMGDPKKGIYYTSALVKQILEANDHENRRVKFVNAGVKMFMKQDIKHDDACQWRIQIEGLPIIQGWVGSDKSVEMWRKDTLYILLKEMFVKVEDKNPTNGHTWRSLPDIGEHVRDLPIGCYILRFKKTESDEGYNQDMTFPLWKGVNSVNLMAPKEERKALLYRIFKDDSELINNNDKHDKNTNGQAGKLEGSVSGQADAEELQERIERGDDPSVEMEDDGGVDGAAMALEEDAVAKRDDLEREKMEVIEMEDTKVTEAMPERQGEGDDYNTTV